MWRKHTHTHHLLHTCVFLWDLWMNEERWSFRSFQIFLRNKTRLVLRIFDCHMCKTNKVITIYHRNYTQGPPNSNQKEKNLEPLKVLESNALCQNTQLKTALYNRVGKKNGSQITTLHRKNSQKETKNITTVKKLWMYTTTFPTIYQKQSSRETITELVGCVTFLLLFFFCYFWLFASHIKPHLVCCVVVVVVVRRLPLAAAAVVAVFLSCLIYFYISRI